MPEGLDATSMWYMMKHHCQLHQADRTVGRKLERFMVSFVISPSKEESENFTMRDWQNLQDEALRALDMLYVVPKGKKKKVQTNFRNSMNVGGLHFDSKSGTVHLHLDCCRVDMDGNTNDVHDIHQRAMRAAEIINECHGWKQPQEIRETRKEVIAKSLERTLFGMERFDFDVYFDRLRQRGYDINPRYDRQHRLVGYTLGKGASVFKASELGRKFMASKLEETWKKMHPMAGRVRTSPSSASLISTARPSRPVVSSPTFTQTKVEPRVMPKPKPLYSFFDINVGGEIKEVRIPNTVKDIFFNEAEVPADNVVAKKEDVIHVAMLFFAGYVDAATSMSVSCGGGGGSTSDFPKKKDDEDDWKFAHRCVRMAHSACKPKQRSRGFHR